MHASRQTAVPWYLAVAAIGVVVHPMLPSSGWVTYLAVTLLAVIAAVVGMRWNRPTDPATWWLLVAALALSFVGSAAWYVLDAFDGDLSFAHVLYLAAYLTGVVGVWRFGRQRSDTGRAMALLDTAIVMTAAAILTWVFLSGPTWSTVPLDGGERLVRTAYPMINLAMLAALVRLAFGGAQRVRAYWLLIAGVAALLTAELGAAAGLVYGAPSSTVTDTIRLGGLGLLGASLLDPSMGRVAATDGPGRVELSRTRLIILWVAAAVAPVTLFVRLGAGAVVELGVVALGSLVLFTLVLMRMWGLLRMLADYSRREHEDRFRALVENADDVILTVETDGTVTYVSPSSERVWGYPPEVIQEHGLAGVVEDDRQRLLEAVQTLRDGGSVGPERVAGQLLHADGGWRRFEATLADRREDPAIEGIVLTARDVTTRWGLERQLAHRTFHDALTGLPNRALFVDRLHQALEPARDSGTFTAVLLLDLDDFRRVNDMLGHDRGDELLRVIARRLSDTIRPHDTLARLGGDEFGLLLPGMSSQHQVTAIAARILAETDDTVAVDGRQLEVRASLGIAISSPDATAPDLLRDADAAMYEAKREGRGSFRLFDPVMHAEAVERLQLKLDLQGAVDRDELRLVYQPIVEIETEELHGVEALLRWEHPTRGLVSPLEFIPLAEESGTIGPLGRFVLHRACTDVAAYRCRTTRDVFVTVNVSPLQLHDPGFTASVEQALADSGLPASALTLELTESIFLDDDMHTYDALARLTQLGVCLAIDDFGTGYCSLGYLNRFPFDVVKIDRSFIDALGVAGGDRRLTIGMLELIDKLEVPAVAEGVETQAQLQVLRDAGCRYGQGYLWSRPVPIEDVPVPRAASADELIARAAGG